MNFFKRLFGGNKENKGRDNNLSEEEFFNSDFIRSIIEKYKRQATLLRPHRSKFPIDVFESKFGGVPNFDGFKSYPVCDTCNAPLNFVLQLYKWDFPAFYFPGAANLFQLFRCPDNNCADAFSEHYDHKMFHYYFEVEVTEPKQLVKPVYTTGDLEEEVPDCYLKPQTADDLPMLDDEIEDELFQVERKFGEDYAEVFSEKYLAVTGSKFGGYPSFTQSAYYPECSCGNLKEFFFQLSSEDREEGVKYPPAPDQWSPHNIMIGDVGNIYYYVCKACGPSTIESYWDCS